MKNNKLNSIRLNQITDSNKIDNETFAIIYLESQINKVKLIRKYFGGCKQLNMDANCKINSRSTLFTLYVLLDNTEKLIKDGNLKGIKMHKNGLFMATGK